MLALGGSLRLAILAEYVNKAAVGQRWHRDVGHIVQSGLVIQRRGKYAARIGQEGNSQTRGFRLRASCLHRRELDTLRIGSLACGDIKGGPDQFERLPLGVTYELGMREKDALHPVTASRPHLERVRGLPHRVGDGLPQALGIVWVDSLEQRLTGWFHFAIAIAEQTVRFGRPVVDICADIPLPATELRQRLCTLQARLTITQRRLDLLAGGDVGVDLEAGQGPTLIVPLGRPAARDNQLCAVATRMDEFALPVPIAE